MELEVSESISVMDRVKIQAQVLLPLARILREELGPEGAQEILRRAIGEAQREQVRQEASQLQGSPLEKFQAMMARSASINGPQLELEMLEAKPQLMRFNVTSCKYAQLFQALGESEIGAMLLCDTDAYVAEIGGEEVEFTRSQTIMNGSSHCDFCYRVHAGSR